MLVWFRDRVCKIISLTTSTHCYLLYQFPGSPQLFLRQGSALEPTVCSHGQLPLSDPPRWDHPRRPTGPQNVWSHHMGKPLLSKDSKKLLQGHTNTGFTMAIQFLKNARSPIRSTSGNERQTHLSPVLSFIQWISILGLLWGLNGMVHFKNPWYCAWHVSQAQQY